MSSLEDMLIRLLMILSVKENDPGIGSRLCKLRISVILETLYCMMNSPP